MRALLAAALVLTATPALADGIGWQEAVARLAGKRTRAETCARLLKKYGDEPAIARGELTYGDAKAEIDAVIAGLTIALVKDEEPPSLPDLEAHLERGVNDLDEVCKTAYALVPETGNERTIFVPILVAALPPLVLAAQEIYLDYRREVREDELLLRMTIQNQLEATQWPAFAAIASD